MPLAPVDISDEDSDDDKSTQLTGSVRIECNCVETKEPKILQFRDAFEEGHAQEHKVVAVDEGFRFGIS